MIASPLAVVILCGRFWALQDNGHLIFLNPFVSPHFRVKQNSRGEISCAKLSVHALLWLAAGMIVSTVSLHAADTLKIGIVAPTTGAAAEAGRYEMQGAKLAVEEINKAGGVLGKQIELISEDDQTTNPGAVMAFSKLVGNKDIAAFIRNRSQHSDDGHRT